MILPNYLYFIHIPLKPSNYIIRQAKEKAVLRKKSVLKVKNMNERLKARELAKKLHDGQFRRDGKPYFTHVEAVANYLTNNYTSLFPQSAVKGGWFKLDVQDCVIAAAYGHDLIEDTDVSLDYLNDNFKPMTVELIKMVTKRKDETYFDFIMRINESHPYRVGAVAIKLADLYHNMHDNPKEGSLMDKYRFAAYILSYLTGDLSTNLKNGAVI